MCCVYCCEICTAHLAIMKVFSLKSFSEDRCLVSLQNLSSHIYKLAISAVSKLAKNYVALKK